MKLFREMGYRIEKLCPAVAPLKTSPEAVKGLKGVRAHGRVSAVSSGKVLASQTGEIQFTENSLSGICVFNLSYLFSRYEGNLQLEVDFLPELSEAEVRKLLTQIRNERAKHDIEDYLNGIFVKNLSVYIAKRFIPHPLTDMISSVTDEEISVLAVAIKSVSFNVTGCSSWQNAQATHGGISGSCVDEYLCSRSDPGIYFAGEILDVDGECGGYNLEWAWSSGKWAGANCARSLSEKN
jgi:predicted Rossmann fold flavoprotein